MFLEPTTMAPRDSNRISRSYVPTNHPILKPFGVQLTIPKGAAIAIRGPVDLPPGAVRYGGVLIVK